MTTYHIGSDNIDGKELQYCNAIANILQSCGHQTQVYSQGPNKEGLARQIGSKGDDVLIFLCGGVDGCTEWSIKNCVQSGACCKVIFAYAGWAINDVNNSVHSQESCFNLQIGPSWDAGQYLNASSKTACKNDINNRNHQQYINDNAQYIGLCYSKIGPEDLAQQICSGTCGQGGSSQTTTETTTESSISVTKIPDISFFGVINQICGAVDALFIIANNMAYLLSFSDYYKYKEKYDSDIPKIESSDVIANSLEKDWAVDGFYNAVNVKYKNGELNYQYDALVEKYGENVFYYDLSEDDRETAITKAKALLSAHVRDYSIDLHLQCLYNHKITVGSWVKVRTTLSEVNQNIDIKENSNNIVQTESLSSKKYLTTTEEGYEIFFVQGYNIKWGYEKALIMDLHLKYGPDTPQDPINATFTTGSIQTNSSEGVGGYGSDCFSGDEICPANSTKIMGHYSGSSGTAQCKSLMNSKYLPTQKEYAPRAMQGSSYDQQLSGKTPQEAFLYFQNNSQYCYYADFCKLNGDTNSGGDCCNVLWDALLSKQIRGLNCGDSMRMLKVFFDCTGTPACGVHIDGHYFNAIQLNGTWEIIDGTRSHGNNTTGFPGGSHYTFNGRHSKSCSPCAF